MEGLPKYGWKGYRSDVERVCRKGVVYAAFGVGFEHWRTYYENWLREM